jgi:hypothetical protein
LFTGWCNRGKMQHSSVHDAARSPTIRLSLILRPVQPEVYPAVECCPYVGCGVTLASVFIDAD